MIILIDGYNLLKQRSSNRIISEQEREVFIAQMNRYARRKKHKVVVVFDGGQSSWLHKEYMQKVEVLYSGTYENADEVIKSYLEIHQHSEILLVSADNDLTRWAGRFDIPSIHPLDFMGLVQEALGDTVAAILPGGQLEKITTQQDASIDTLMLEFSESVPLKHEDAAADVRATVSAGRSTSKVDKKLLKILKKL